MKNEHIICVSEVGWDRIWQRQNEVMTKLSSTNDILVIENLELRVRREYFTRKKFVRVFTKIFAIIKKILRRVRRVNNGIIVFSPFFLPFNRPEFFAKLNAKILMRSLNKLTRRLELYHPIFWIYLPSALVVELISNIPHKAVVYDCYSDFSSNPLPSENFETSEQEIIKRARIVFVASRNLHRRIVKKNPNTFFIPNGVDFLLFQKVRTTQTEVPSDMSFIPHPIMGYTGTLHYWVDFDLLAYLADSHPDWSIVLIGPVDALIDMSELFKKNNACILSAKMHDEILYYIKSFDVSIIPYKIHEFTKYVYPTKLHEYLALGKPVVSTKLSELAPYRHIVKIASDKKDFVKHVENLLKNRERGHEKTCVQLAKQHSWDTVVEQMATKLSHCI